MSKNTSGKSWFLCMLFGVLASWGIPMITETLITAVLGKNETAVPYIVMFLYTLVLIGSATFAFIRRFWKTDHWMGYATIPFNLGLAAYLFFGSRNAADYGYSAVLAIQIPLLILATYFVLPLRATKKAQRPAA